MSDTLSLRDAGNLIDESGLSDDVIKADEDSLLTRDEIDQDDVDDQESSDSTPEEEEADLDTSDNETDNSDDSADSDAEGTAKIDPLTKEYDVVVDGATQKVPLSELIKGYSREADYHAKTRTLSAERTELYNSHAQVAQQYQQQLQQSQFVVSTVRDILVGEMNSPQMQQLQATDPQRWAVERSVMQQRAEQVNGILDQINQEFGRHQQNYLNQQQQQLQQRVTTEADLLKKAIPDWGDKRSQNLTQYLKDQGFADQELKTVYDHRMLVIAEKARLYDQAAKAKKNIKKKPKQTNKPIKSSGGQIQRKGSGNVQKQNRYSKARKHAKQTGNMRDAGKAIALMIDD